MAHEESVLKAANTAILEQVRQPPPGSVLVGLVETVGGAPDVVAAVVQWGEASTTWDVYACRGDILARVLATKGVTDWYGSGREDEGAPAVITTSAHRISDARSIGAEDLIGHPNYAGFTRHCQARWIVRFDDGAIELDESVSRYGQNVAEVARYVRERFLNPE